MFGTTLWTKAWLPSLLLFYVVQKKGSGKTCEYKSHVDIMLDAPWIYIYGDILEKTDTSRTYCFCSRGPLAVAWTVGCIFFVALFFVACLLLKICHQYVYHAYTLYNYVRINIVPLQILPAGCHWIDIYFFWWIPKITDAAEMLYKNNWSYSNVPDTSM